MHSYWIRRGTLRVPNCEQRSARNQNTKSIQKKSNLYLLLAFIFTLSLSNALAQEYPSREEAKKLKDFVNLGIKYIKQHGEKTTYAEINNTNGELRRGELYLFVITYDGLCLAHGQDQSLVGKNLYDLQDKYGTSFVKTMVDIAKKGGGLVSYYWPNPATQEVQYKVSYIMPINDHTFVGAGIYKG